MTELAQAPCAQCPWRRESVPGFLGPATPEQWCEIAHSESPIYCHMTIHTGHADPDDPRLRHCAGAAIFRANVNKTLRDPDVPQAEPDHVTVFTWDDQFIEHHT